MRRLVPLSALTIAACVPATPPPPAPVAPPRVAAATPARPAALPADWRDWPLTPGTWRYTGGATAATFGGATPVLTLACDRPARQVRLALVGAGTDAATVPSLSVRTSSATRTLAAPGHVMALAAADPLLDAMAFSRGHFTIEEAGRPPLVVPAHAEVGRVVQDCRG